MGMTQSINKVNFEDVQYAVKHKNYLLFVIKKCKRIESIVRFVPNIFVLLLKNRCFYIVHSLNCCYYGKIQKEPGRPQERS